MKRNRSVPAATVIPVLIYPDVREAVDWLCAAFGFVERLRIGEDHRSQLKVGGGGAPGKRRPPPAPRGGGRGRVRGRPRTRSPPPATCGRDHPLRDRAGGG